MPLNSQDLDLATESYLNGDYELASSLYSKLLQSEPDNPYLLISYGNSSHELQQYGKSIQPYYSAKKIIPRNKELNHNLAIVQNEIKLKQPHMLAFNGLNLFESLLIFLIINILFILRTRLKFTKLIQSTLTLLLVISGLNLAYLYYEHESKQYAVIQDITATAYSGDNAAYSELFELLDGQIIEVVKAGETWSQVKYDANLGWMKNSSFARL